MRVHGRIVVRGAAVAACLAAALAFPACGGRGPDKDSSGGSVESAGTTTPSSPDAPSGGTAPAAPGAAPAAEAAGSASVTGRAMFTGKPPKRRPITMTADPGCQHPGGGEALSDDVLVAEDGALQNVWVRVVSGLGGRTFTPPAAAIELDQAGCAFTPHAAIAMTGQAILFKNGDKVAHNVHALPKLNPGFNVTLPPGGKPSERRFTKAEAVRVKCDIHPWMGSWVLVHDAPFQSLTGSDGRFAIQGLPAGTYEIEAWHERLGALPKQSVTLGDGEAKTIDFSFAPPKS